VSVAPNDVTSIGMPSKETTGPACSPCASWRCTPRGRGRRHLASCCRWGSDRWGSDRRGDCRLEPAAAAHGLVVDIGEFDATFLGVDAKAGGVRMDTEQGPHHAGGDILLAPGQPFIAAGDGAVLDGHERAAILRALTAETISPATSRLIRFCLAGGLSKGRASSSRPWSSEVPWMALSASRPSARARRRSV